LFAQYAELLGTESLALTMPAGATVGQVIETLRRSPGGALLPARLLVARNLVQAGESEQVAPGDEVAVLPPMSGG